MATTVRKEDVDRLASRFGRAPEAMNMAVGMDARAAASHLGLSETELVRAVEENVEFDNRSAGAKKAAATRTAKKAPAKKAAAKKTARPRKTAAKKTATKRAAKRSR